MNNSKAKYFTILIFQVLLMVQLGRAGYKCPTDLLESFNETFTGSQMNWTRWNDKYSYGIFQTEIDRKTLANVNYLETNFDFGNGQRGLRARVTNEPCQQNTTHSNLCYGYLNDSSKYDTTYWAGSRFASQKCFKYGTIELVAKFDLSGAHDVRAFIAGFIYSLPANSPLIHDEMIFGFSDLSTQKKISAGFWTNDNQTLILDQNVTINAATKIPASSIFNTWTKYTIEWTPYNITFKLNDTITYLSAQNDTIQVPTLPQRGEMFSLNIHTTLMTYDSLIISKQLLISN